MLVLTRKPGESINGDLLEEIDPRTPVGELLAGGPIEVVVLGVKRGQVKLGLRADARFLILREELCRRRGRVGKVAALPVVERE